MSGYTDAPAAAPTRLTPTGASFGPLTIFVVGVGVAVMQLVGRLDQFGDAGGRNNAAEDTL